MRSWLAQKRSLQPRVSPAQQKPAVGDLQPHSCHGDDDPGEPGEQGVAREREGEGGRQQEIESGEKEKEEGHANYIKYTTTIGELRMK